MFFLLLWFQMGFPGGHGGKEPACPCRRLKRCRFDPWVRKIPGRRARQPTPVFLPGESHGPRSLAGCSSIGSQRIGHNQSNLACMQACDPVDLRKIIEDREERSCGSRNVLRHDIRTTEQGCLWRLVELMNNPWTAQRSCGLRRMRDRASASPVLGRKCLEISQDGEIVCLSKSECTSGCGEGLSVQPGRLSRGSQAGGCFGGGGWFSL